MQRPQKTTKVGCPCEGMMETKSNKGACSIALTETDREDGAENLLERILDRNNLNQAYLKVKRNGGSAGIDGMTVEEMLPYLKEHSEELLEGKLKLKVNRKKSQVGSPLRLKFLGFSMYKTGKKAGIRPHGKSTKKFKDKIRELTSRKQARSVELILKRLKRYTVGWLGYYSIADMESRIKRLNEWIRRRIRQIYWKQWKKIKTKHDNLVKLGIDNENAWKWANSRKAYWRVSGSHILAMSLTNKYLALVGYDDILERYKVLHSSY